MKQNRIIVGLTGTIASGKTVCADIFKNDYGIPVVDADRLAKEVTKPGSEGLEKIAEVFGSEYIKEDGSYNRELMRDLITKDESALETLNALLHPLIKKARERAFLNLKDEPVIIYDCPLLFEAGEDRIVDEILLVSTDEKTRLERLMERDSVSKEAAEGMIAIQLDEDEKRKRTDSVISNDGSIADLKETIGKYLEKLKRP